MTDDRPTRATHQEDLELDPADHDPTANGDLGKIGIAPAKMFEQALEQTRMAITIVDPHRPDSPIIYANRAFTELTGYARDEVVGRNCRFLQGPHTDPAAIEAMRECIETREVRVIEALNYRKDGSTFWNSLHIGPVFDDAGRLTHLYGSQWDVTDVVEGRNRLAMQVEVADELQHRTRNLFSVISSIVSLSAHGTTDVRTLVDKVRARLMALSKAHAISVSEGRVAGRSSNLFDLVATILAPYQSEGVERIRLSGPVVHVPRDAVTPVGLMLHELATNALKYGALGASGGTVEVAWSREGDRLRLTWTEAGGPAVEAPGARGAGSRMMEAVLGTIGAGIAYDWPPSGLSATLDLVLED